MCFFKNCPKCFLKRSYNSKIKIFITNFYFSIGKIKIYDKYLDFTIVATLQKTFRTIFLPYRKNQNNSEKVYV